MVPQLDGLGVLKAIRAAGVHARQCRPLLQGRRDCVRLYGLEGNVPAAGGWPDCLHGAQAALRLDENQRRDGHLLSLKARARLCVQGGNGSAHQHLWSRRHRQVPNECLGVPRHQQHARRRACSAPYTKARCNGCRRVARRHATRRGGVRPVCWLGNHPNRCRGHWSLRPPHRI